MTTQPDRSRRIASEHAAVAARLMRDAAPHTTSHLRAGYTALHLDTIFTAREHRRTGEATAALNALTAYADAHHLTLALTPDPIFGTPKAALVRLYARHGFIPNSGRNRSYEILDTMYRRPLG